MNKDNTFRALQDQELIPERRWKCRFGFHRWLKWSEVERKSTNVWAHQYRSCADCNATVVRRLRGEY